MHFGKFSNSKKTDLSECLINKNMKTLKTLIINKYETLSMLFSALIMSFILLMVRIKLNKSFFYLFLVWNIFLAIIPYVITVYLSRIKLNKIKLGFGFCVWLLFLPNAPYIITDLLHLRVSTTHILWLDILVISSFAITGMLLFFLSLNEMKALIKLHFNKFPAGVIITTVILLCGFGVYLGRFLRYNSWEILSNPQQLLLDVIEMLIHPFEHSEVWLFTFGFGGFLFIIFRIFNKN